MIELKEQSLTINESVQETTNDVIETDETQVGTITVNETENNVIESLNGDDTFNQEIESDAVIIVPQGTTNINTNGTHDVTEYAFANVQVQADVIDVYENGVSVVGADKIARTTKPTKTSELTNDSGFLTEHQSLSGYATEQWVEDKGYLTEHQSLSNYYTKSETNSQISSHHDSTKYDASNPSGFITNSAITGKENTSNKVTTISSASSDTQYPSAKCVYDIVGNIEATLRAIRGV